MLLKCWTQYASKFGKPSSGHRSGTGQFSFQFQRKAMPKNVAVGLPKGRAFQAEGTINAIVLAGQSIWCASKFQGVLWCSGFDMVQCIWHSLKRVWCCCLCFSHNLWSSAFHRWRTQGSNVCPAPSFLAIPEIRSETFWSMMRDRELEYTSCRDDSIHAKCQSTSGYQL